MTKEQFSSNTNWKMTYEEFQNAIVHRGTYKSHALTAV